MSEIFNIILVSLSRLLFSSPTFVIMAETSLSGARRVQDSSGVLSPTGSDGGLVLGSLREVPISDKARESPPSLEAATARPSAHDIRRASLEDGWRDTVLIAPPATAAGPTESAAGLGRNISPVVSEPYYPLSDSDDDNLAPDSFSLSLVSDTSVDGEFNVSGSLDTLLSSPPPCSVTLQSSKLLPHVSGLGISGLTRKDGSGPFDGLGIVSIKSPSWRLEPSEIQRDGINLSDSVQGFLPSSCSSFAYDGSSESGDFDQSLLVTGDRLSDVFLQEALLTFTEAPYHELCRSSVVSSSTIPDCGDSWSELCLDESVILAPTPKLADDKSRSASGSQPILPALNYRRQTPRISTNFSSPTISSELKRSSIINLPKSSPSRNRSSSWPCSATEGTTATPLARSKWRF